MILLSILAFPLLLPVQSDLAESAEAADADERLHPVEQYCIEYQPSGAMRGGWTRVCSRNYGAESFTVNYNEGKGGNSRTGEEWVTVCHTQTIQIGGMNYTFDLNDDIGIAFENQQYPIQVAAARAYFEQGSPDAYLGVWGFEPTGTQEVVAGLTCNNYENPAQRVRQCYTEDLLMLKSEGTGFLKYVLTATQVEVGVDGGDENYRLQETRSYQKLADNMIYNIQCKRKDELKAE